MTGTMTGPMTGRMLLCALALVLMSPAPGSAQTYPDRPIRMIVPFPPGGPIDTMARIAAQHISASVGQTVVENRPGGGTTIAVKAVASAQPDGYTLLFGSSGSLSVAPTLYVNAGVDPVKQFAPVASFALLPHIMVVPAEQVPAKTVAEFIAFAKQNTGKLNYGAGLGSPPHLLSTLFVRKADIDATYVPYQGAAQAVTDMLAGRNHFIIDGTTILMPHVRSGKFRAIGTGRPERWHELPDVPTIAEQGFPDFTLDAWAGIMAPAGTPAPIIERLNAAISAGLATAETKAALDRFSAISKASTPEEFAAFVADQAKRWGDLVRLTGARIE